MSHGEYIGFVDSDDSILPDMFENMLKLIVENHVDVVCSSMIVEGRNAYIQKKIFF